MRPGKTSSIHAVSTCVELINIHRVTPPETLLRKRTIAHRERKSFYRIPPNALLSPALEPNLLSPEEPGNPNRASLSRTRILRRQEATEPTAVPIKCCRPWVTSLCGGSASDFA